MTTDNLRLAISTCVRNPKAAPGEKTYTGINPRTLQGWTRIRVTAGIERFPRDFEVSYTEAFPGAADIVVQEGDICQVYLGEDLVITGFVDKRMLSINGRDHILAISGRGACSDLVDCSARWEGGQFLNQTITTIARDLAGIYGITVALDKNANQGLPIPQLVIIQGESIFSILDRLARFRALLLLEQPDGTLFISAVGTQSMASGFQEGVNVQAAAAVFDMDIRYSNYVALQQGLDIMKDIGHGGNLIAEVVDPGVPRLRYKTIVADPVISGQDVAARRAHWELARRYGRSRQVRITTDTWRDSAGTLWTPNRLVTLNLPSIKIVNLTWLIAEVTFYLDENGTRAELVIMQPEGFLPQPIILNPVAPDIVVPT